MDTFGSALAVVSIDLMVSVSNNLDHNQDRYFRPVLCIAYWLSLMAIFGLASMTERSAF
jgi:hypothetical protein